MVLLQIHYKLYIKKKLKINKVKASISKPCIKCIYSPYVDKKKSFQKYTIIPKGRISSYERIHNFFFFIYETNDFEGYWHYSDTYGKQNRQLLFDNDKQTT